ncbi:hypothetical protein CRYUN_Cryun27aG0121900 [Craigia yunnanensis]
MLKQILSKLPRKSQKYDSLDSAGIDSSNHTSNSGNGVQCTNIGNSISSQLSVVKRVFSVVFPASIMAGVEAVEPNLFQGCFKSTESKPVYQQIESVL